MKLNLASGETEPLNLTGKNFYFSSGIYPIRVKVIGLSERREFDISAGQGFKFDDFRFTNIEITNLGAATQDIEFEVSDAEIYDNRAVLSVGSSLPVVVQSASASRLVSSDTLLATTAKEVLASDVNRVKAMLNFAGDVYLGHDNTVTNLTGFLWTGGSLWIDESTSSLWAYSVAGTTVKIIQDRK